MPPSSGGLLYFILKWGLKNGGIFLENLEFGRCIILSHATNPHSEKRGSSGVEVVSWKFGFSVHLFYSFSIQGGDPKFPVVLFATSNMYS